MKKFPKLPSLALSLLAFVAHGAAQAGPWDGGYLGASLGQADGNSTHSFVAGSAKTTHGLQNQVSSVQGGYNWQSGALVYGLAADFTSDVAGSGPCPNPSFQCKTQVRKLTTMSGRMGAVLGGSYLVYGSLGLALADVKAYGQPATVGDGETKSRSGTAFGVGAVGPVSFFGNNWNWQAQYDYVDLGAMPQKLNTFPEIASVKVSFTVLRVGLNYKF